MFRWTLVSVFVLPGQMLQVGLLLNRDIILFYILSKTRD